jgi:hypothetical protein
MRTVHILSFTAAVVVTTALFPTIASAERVCRQECLGPVCSEKCVETDGRGDRRDGVEIRREGRGDRLDGRAPGVELRVPGVEVEIGGGRR